MKTKITSLLLVPLFLILAGLHAAEIPLMDGRTFRGWEGDTNQTWRIIVKNLANPNNTAFAAFTVTTLLDSDGDGIPDNWETSYNLNPGSGSDRNLDSDGDGLSNYQEYLAGTDPTNALSTLKITLSGVPGLPVVTFPAISNKTYTVQFKDNLNVASWQRLADIAARTNNRVEIVPDPAAGTNRFYRVATPRQP